MPSVNLPRVSALLCALPDLILSSGLCLALYARWAFFQHASLLILGSCGVIVALLSLTNRTPLLISLLSRAWLGTALGTVCFLDLAPSQQHSVEEVANALLCFSVLYQLLVMLVLQLCRTTGIQQQQPPSSPLKGSETIVVNPPSPTLGLFVEILGVVIACVFFIGPLSPPVLGLLFSFCMILLAVHLKSFTALALLAFLTYSAEHYLFVDLHHSVNMYAVLTLACRNLCDPLVRLVFFGTSRLDRWQPFIRSSRCVQLSLVCLGMLVEVEFFISHISVIGSHSEWIVVVPLFCIVASFWILLHLGLLAIWMSLLSRFVKCRETCSFESLEQLKKSLTAKGVRFFALVAYRVVFVCIVFTIGLTALCWTTRSLYTHTSFVSAILIELMSLELLLCFTQQLGGTTIGYALVAPCVSPAHTDTGSADVSLIPAALAASAHARSTQVLDTIVRFFAAHLITNFGCDWSIHGCALADIEQKLRLFFAQTTAEGPRYDTYVLYYAGPTAENGDWALQNDNHLSLSAILVLWNSEADLSGDNKPRLLVISDTFNGAQWCRQVRDSTSIVALQTCHTNEMSQSGRFTDLYSEYNLTTSGDPSVFTEMSPVYAVSRTWSSFQFHLPTSDDTLTYWLQTSPSCLHRPVRALMRLALLSSKCSCWPSCVLLRRARLRWCPPAHLNTGHGFALVSLRPGRRRLL